MKRARVLRLASDRLPRAPALALPGPGRSGRAQGGAAARQARAWSALALAGEIVGAIRARRRVRVLLLALLIGLPLVFFGWRWLRTSSLVSVDRVQVTGAHGPDAHEIDAALVTAGKRMTTLDVNRHALLAAVAPFHLVRSLSVSTSFPHGLRIRVIERLAVATLNVSGAQTAVAADGTVL